MSGAGVRCRCQVQGSGAGVRCRGQVQGSGAGVKRRGQAQGSAGLTTSKYPVDGIGREPKGLARIGEGLRPRVKKAWLKIMIMILESGKYDPFVLIYALRSNRWKFTMLFL